MRPNNPEMFKWFNETLWPLGKVSQRCVHLFYARPNVIICALYVHVYVLYLFPLFAKCVCEIRNGFLGAYIHLHI